MHYSTERDRLSCAISGSRASMAALARASIALALARAARVEAQPASPHQAPVLRLNSGIRFIDPDATPPLPRSMGMADPAARQPVPLIPPCNAALAAGSRAPVRGHAGWPAALPCHWGVSVQ